MQKILTYYIITLTAINSFGVIFAQDAYRPQHQNKVTIGTQQIINLIEKYESIVPSRQVVSLANYYVDKKSRSAKNEVRSVLSALMVSLYDRGLAQEIATRYTSPTGISLILPTDLSAAIYYQGTGSLPYEYEGGVNIKNDQVSTFGAENNFNILVEQYPALSRELLEQIMTQKANERIQETYALYEGEEIESSCLYDFNYSTNIMGTSTFGMGRDVIYGDECRRSGYGGVRNQETGKIGYWTGGGHDPSFYINTPYVQTEWFTKKQNDMYGNSLMYVFDSILSDSITIR